MNKKGFSLPLNVVVMLIIGIIIFSLGLSFFFQMYEASEDEIDSLNEDVRVGISSIECDGGDWICMPTFDLDSSERRTLFLNIANQGDEEKEFAVDIETDTLSSGNEGIDADCGEVLVGYLEDESYELDVGQSAEIPILAEIENFEDLPCSFVTTATVYESGDPTNEFDSTPLIIRGE